MRGQAVAIGMAAAIVGFALGRWVDAGDTGESAGFGSHEPRHGSRDTEASAPAPVSAPSTAQPPNHEDRAVSLDASVPSVPDEREDLRACFGAVFQRPEAVIAIVARSHHSARAECFRNHLPQATSIPSDPHSPCGDLSETLWSASDNVLRPWMLSLLEIGAYVPDDDFVFRGLDCTTLSAQDFAASSHFAVLSPTSVDGDFLACAVRRATSGETFALWSLLDAARNNPRARDALQNLAVDTFTEERTRRRVASLRQQQQPGR